MAHVVLDTALDTQSNAARDELVSDWLFEEATLRVKTYRTNTKKRVRRAHRTVCQLRKLLTPDAISDLRFFYNRVRPGAPILDVTNLQVLHYTEMSDRKLDSISMADIETEAKVILFKYYYGSNWSEPGLFRDTIKHIFNGEMMEFNVKIAYDLCIEKCMPKLAALVTRLPKKLQLFRQFYKDLSAYDAISNVYDVV